MRGLATAEGLAAEGFQPLQGIQGPDFDGVVIRAGKKLVAADGEREHRSGMVFQDVLAAPCFDIPHPDGLVCGGTEQPISRHLHGPHNLIMALQVQNRGSAMSL